MTLPRSVLGAALLSVLVACSGASSNDANPATKNGKGDTGTGSSGGSGASNGSDGGSGAHASCRVDAFADAAVDFALPTLGAAGSSMVPFSTLAGSGYVDDAETDDVTFTTVDINGDGVLDLVLTRRYTDAAVGKSVWKVFKGDGKGFAASSTDFALPKLTSAASTMAPLATLSGSAYVDDAETDDVTFTTIDLNGDGLLDLVLTRRTSDAAVGKTVWKLFKGDGNGFAATSTDFALPKLGYAASAMAPFATLAGSAYVDDAETDDVTFATVDLDGDGLLDLVITRRSSDAAVGKTVWKLFKGDGKGFAATSTDFTLPKLASTASAMVPIATLAGSAYVDDAETDDVTFATVDLDGDARLDLVLTRRSSDTAVGKSVWKVFEGSSGGFAATSTDFTLPALTSAASAMVPLATLAGSSYVDDAETDDVTFATIDLDGDGALDLALTRRSSDSAVGKSVWKVFKGSSSGFAATSTDFTLPSTGGSSTMTPFATLAGSSYVDDAETDDVSFTTVDVDGDHKLDFVFTRRSSDAAVGKTVWKVFKGSCE